MEQSNVLVVDVEEEVDVWDVVMVELLEVVVEVLGLVEDVLDDVLLAVCV